MLYKDWSPQLRRSNILQKPKKINKERKKESFTNVVILVMRKFFYVFCRFIFFSLFYHSHQFFYIYFTV